MSDQKNPANVIRGLKAAIHNPNVSDEAKQRDLERLQEMGEDTSALAATLDMPVTQEVSGGSDYNTRSGPHVALKLDEHEAAMKEVAKQMLEEEQLETQDMSSEGQEAGGHNLNRVLGGYKATLSNPHTSEAAKAHAEQVLDEYGA